jgi:hypothetical protein
MYRPKAGMRATTTEIRMDRVTHVHPIGTIQITITGTRLTTGIPTVKTHMVKIPTITTIPTDKIPTTKIPMATITPMARIHTITKIKTAGIPTIIAVMAKTTEILMDRMTAEVPMGRVIIEIPMDRMTAGIPMITAVMVKMREDHPITGRYIIGFPLRTEHL